MNYGYLWDDDVWSIPYTKKGVCSPVLFLIRSTPKKKNVFAFVFNLKYTK